MSCYVDYDFYIDGSYNIGKGRPPDSMDYLTQRREIYEEYKQQGKSITYLSERLGYPNTFTVLDMYTHLYAGECSDTDMVLTLLKGFTAIDSTETYCLCLNNSFCWFHFAKTGLQIDGFDSFSQDTSEYSCGTYVKQLKRTMVRQGVALPKLYFLTYGKLDRVWRTYITPTCDLYDVLASLDGFETHSVSDSIDLLRYNITEPIKETAVAFIHALSDSNRVLHLKGKEGVLTYRHNFYKDYSLCKGSVEKLSNCQYGIVLDSEGVKGSDGSLQNGVSEVGGIIYAAYDDKMLSLYTFVSDAKMLESTLTTVIAKYKTITGRSIPKNGIPTYVFGKSDRIMIEAAIANFSQKTKHSLEGKFSINDCIPFITSSVILRNYTGKRSLGNIAKELHVASILPHHNALADAKTLFNVLAGIRKEKK